MAANPRPGEDGDWQRNLVDDDAGLRAILEAARRIAVLGIKDERRPYEPAHYIARYLQEVGYEVSPRGEQYLALTTRKKRR